MKTTYDIFGGEMSLLLNDLNSLKSQLIKANDEIVKELGQNLYNEIMLNANKANEPAQRVDIRTLTKQEFVNQGMTSKITIYNTSPKVTFAEFGYGIVGKGSPYRGESIFDMSKVGWQGYDLDSIRKREDRSWLYRDRQGQLHKSSGEKPTHIWFYATQQTKNRIPEIVSKAIERNLLNK